LILDLFNYFNKPDGLTPSTARASTSWEIGMRGFRPQDLVKRLSRFFDVLAIYRNQDWSPSQNFVLRSRVTDR